MKKKLVSVVIPTYNREEFISDALESCLSQSIKLDEIIVVDNHSTDETCNIVSEYIKKFSNIKLYKNKINVGMVKNWNRCVKLATSEYVGILHSDDVLPPNWHQIIRDKIKSDKSKKISLYFGNVACFTSGDSKMKIISRIRLFSKNTSFAPIESIDKLWRNFFGNPNNSAAIIYKKKIFDEIGYFNPYFQTESDQEFHIRVLSKYSSLYINKDLVFYRRHRYQAFDQNKQVESAVTSAQRITRSVEIQQKLLPDKKLVYYSYCGIYLYLLKFYALADKTAIDIIFKIPNIINIKSISLFPKFFIKLIIRRSFSRYL